MLTPDQVNSFNVDHDTSLNRGIQSLEKSLKTSFIDGIEGNNDVFIKRREKYGSNSIHVPDSKSLFSIFVASFDDTTLQILIVSAIISLSIGMYENPKHGWIEGTSILFAVLLVAVVTAVNDYKKEQQFRVLNKVKDDVDVNCMRNSKMTSVNVADLVVGDLVILNAGDRIPADGIMVEGSDITANESALTGESDDKLKDSLDPFLLSGSTLSTGYCRMLVTAVGINSRWGQIRAKLVEEDDSQTPLQEKLDVLANQIGNVGIFFATCTFIAMVAMFYFYPESRTDRDISLVSYVLKAFIIAVTIVVVAVPEGLPLAVTLSLAYSTQKMMNDNCLIRVLEACETMGNATNICSDKTGTLTENRMTVVKGWFASEMMSDLPASTNLSPKVIEYLSHGASINSTAEIMNNGVGEQYIYGSKTEGAILVFLKNQLQIDYNSIRTEGFNFSRGDRLYTFSSIRKCMSVLLKNGNKDDGISYTKGASEVVLSKCKFYTDKNGKPKKLDVGMRRELVALISDMAKDSLRTIALAHRDLVDIDGAETVEDIEMEMTLDCIFGIKDPLRVDVITAVKTCQEAGIFVRMVTGDNIETAKAIAKECGIYSNGLVMEGPEFRKLTPAQLDEILPNLQVLARSSPDDKHILVSRLNGHSLPKDKEEWLVRHPNRIWELEKDTLLPGYYEEWLESRPDGGEVVGVTGDGTNDGPALKVADVGLSMGLSGTDVAKEASDIVILDDKFSSIVKAVMWGRSVFDNIRKFLQFQLTVNAVALSLTFVCALKGFDLPLNAIMMLWVNLIMDTMGALALGTEPPSADLLQRRPYKRNASLVSNKMIRNITIQFLFQMSLLWYLLTNGSIDMNTKHESVQHMTIVFNTFVFAQIFNEINARSINDEMNVFKGLFKNFLFISILIITMVIQYGLVEYGGEYVGTVHLTNDQWHKCIMLGSLSLPVGGLMRLIPIKDSDNDFAPIEVSVEAARLRFHKSSKKLSSNFFSFTYLIWILVVTIIPVIVYNHFGESWTEKIIDLINSMR